MDHITGKCSFKDPALVTCPNGISAKIFGPWLRAEHSRSVCFINTPVEDCRKISTLGRGKVTEELQQLTANPRYASLGSPICIGIGDREQHANLEYGKFK